jgi:protein-L-isoaspartate(D-aspartate) O-methyltransferase
MQPFSALMPPPQLHAMIDGQLRPNGVSDHGLLARVAALPRAPFAPQGAEAAALYADQPFTLSATRSLLPPRTAACLIQALELKAHSRVLVVAAATGYEAALLAPLVQRVTACEQDPDLLKMLRSNLAVYPNAEVLPFGPTQPLAIAQAYTHIFIAAPFAVLPPTLGQILAEGGRLAGVQVNDAGLPTALVRTKHGKSWLEETLFESPAGPVHPALAATEHFVF